MKNKVLIPGGAGYIGGYMADLLIENGYEVTIFDNLLFETRFMKNIDFINGDVRDYNSINKIINNYDTVIWLAAMVGDGACQVNPEETKALNVDALINLVDNFKGKIVFPSTCSVYGINDNLIDELAVPNPLSIYASTKLEAEKYLLANRPDSIVFRLGTLFGLGDSHSRVRLDLVANILSMKAAQGKPLTVFGGEQWRPLLHVRDVATATLHFLQEGIDGLYNLSYENYRIADLAKEIKQVIPNCEVSYTDMSFEDLRNYKVKNDKVLSTGWKPQYNLKDGINEISTLINENRIKDTTDPIYSNAAYVKGLYEN